MVKYTPRHFGNAFFHLAALYGPRDTSHMTIKKYPKFKIRFKQCEGKNCKIQVTQLKRMVIFELATLYRQSDTTVKTKQSPQKCSLNCKNSLNPI